MFPLITVYIINRFDLQLASQVRNNIQSLDHVPRNGPDTYGRNVENFGKPIIGLGD